MAIQEVSQRIGNTTLYSYLIPLTQAQTSTNSDAVISDTEVDAGPFDFMGIGAIVTANSIIITVEAANTANFSDKGIIHTETLTVGTHAVLTQNNGFLSHRFVRVLIRSAVAGAHGTARVSIHFKKKRRTAT